MIQQRIATGRSPSPQRRTWLQLSHFVHDRRAAATTLTAGMFTIMCLAGIALAGDHVHLVYQRDILKGATDAAIIAATRHMASLNSDSDDETKACHTDIPSTDRSGTCNALMPVAKRYILANLPEGRRDQARTTLAIELTPNRAAGTVGMEVEADLGGAAFGTWLWGNVVDNTQVASGVERTEAVITAEVVLAIDVTGSMDKKFTGGTAQEGESSRLAIVKQAALTLVDILAPEGSSTSVAIGVVPWDYRIRLAPNMLTKWEDNSWAQYPTQRYYKNPYKGSTQGESQTLPATKPEDWKGCLDQRAISGDQTPGLSAALQTNTPFVMSFFTPMTQLYSNRLSNKESDYRPMAYTCHGDSDRRRPYEHQDICYSDKDHATYKSPQFECETDSTKTFYIPSITPLTTDIATVRSQIEGLQTSGNATNSTLGVAWGHRLLSHSWQTVWGDATVPVDPAEHPMTRKVLVLLTDGKDNYPDAIRSLETEKVVNGRRNQACTAAKNAGIEVYTIAAMPKDSVRTLGDALKKCSSQPDADPDEKYAFVNNDTAEDLKNAFQKIGTRIVTFRRTH